MKIKELYNCDYITSDEELYPLQKWYNDLLDKTIEEVNIADVLRMIRQDEFIDIAIRRAIDYLKKDPFSGELYDGELMEKVSQLSDQKLSDNISSFMDIVTDALVQNDNHEWITDEEKKEFGNLVNAFKQRLSNMLIQ